MFDSQINSLVTITVLVQILGVAIVVGYHLRYGRPFNFTGLIAGMFVMGGASIVCLAVNPVAGVVQGIGLVTAALATSCFDVSSETI